ncbi:MAG: MATE family efflux transporter [Paludibacteraceae bacterium]|nr:MATE family efflux transporter [Paludibacteraceae bacterium]
MKRDSIDFGKTNIPRLFVKLFIPTVLGMLFNSIFNIADGIFVGKGIGSNALAAVNISAPLYTLSTGLGLLFGTGASVVAQIHLSRKNTKAANINITQALTIPSVLMCGIIVLIMVFAPQLNYIFGGSEKLEPLSVDYIRYVSPTFLFMIIMIVGMFIIRLDGSPKYAMLSNVIPSVLNIFLDWAFIFPLDMGIKGAAIATSTAQGLGALMVLLYFVKKTKVISLYMPKFSRTSLRLTARNAGYMCKLGFATFVGEIAMSFIMMTGNYTFMSRLQEDGVAAFSIACYLLPIIFMFGGAIGQSVLPIVSFNHGLKNKARIYSTLKLALCLTATCGMFMTWLSVMFNDQLLMLFIDKGTRAFEIASSGLDYYSAGFLFISINLVMITFLQSIERSKIALVFMVLRGFVIVLPAFFILPSVIGDAGLWLSIPVAESAVTLLIAVYTVINRKKLY